MSSRDKILHAAIKVFSQKGRHGARIEEIASAAGLNKAMVYYVFNDRETLYKAALKSIMLYLHEKRTAMFLSDIEKGLSSDQILGNLISCEFDIFINNEDYVKMVLEAMSNQSDAVREVMIDLRDVFLKHKKVFIEKVLLKGTAEGLFRDIDPEELFGNIMGLNIVYFLTKPIGNVFCVNVNDSDYLERKKKSIIDLVLNGVLSRK